MTTDNTPLLTLKNICLSLEQKEILNNINLTLMPRSITTIVGPNGGGKSTLLKVLLKLITPTSGEVIYHHKIKIGYVPQKIHLDPNFPISVKRFLSLKAGATAEAIEAVMARLSITHLIKHNMQKLSGGEMQRVLLARAILNQPTLLVLDEPTQGVDITGQAELYQLINRTRDQLNCAILMVSHDLHLVMANTEQVLCINQHICCAGTPETVSNHPQFLHFFGHQAMKNVAFYTHHHNHKHALNGAVCCQNEQKSAHCQH